MGCTSSARSIRIRRRYVVNEAIPGQGLDAYRMFQSVGLTEAEIDYFYNVFITLDEDASGEMDTEEFYGHFNLDRSPYAKRLFEFMDKRSTGEVNFQDFVLHIWYYASLDTRGLGQFVFKLYDTDKDGVLSMAEVVLLVQEVYGKLWDSNPHIKALVDTIARTSMKERWTIDEFQALSVKHAMLVFPAFRIQQQFRRQVFDEAFWMEQLKIRMKRGVNMSPSLEDTIAGIVDYEKSLLTGISSKRQLANMEAKKAKAIKLAAMAELASSAVKPAVSRGSISSQPKRASFADSSLVRRKPGTSESKRDSAATPDPEAASHGRASGSVRQSVSTQPRASVGSKVPGQHHRGSMDSTAAPPKLRTSVKQATISVGKPELHVL